MAYTEDTDRKGNTSASNAPLMFRNPSECSHGRKHLRIYAVGATRSDFAVCVAGQRRKVASKFICYRETSCLHQDD
jgi:hypothetical protein